MDMSVVIVGWNARRYLELCLESLAGAPPRRSMEVLVVDNASSDGSAEMIETRFPWVKLIKSPENLGFAKGNNLAIRQCEGRYIALVNPDVIVFPGCLDALADFLDQNPRVGNVGPRVFEPDMSMQSTCRRFPTLWNNFCSAHPLATTFKSSRLFAGEHMWYFPHDRTLKVDVLVGCFSLIRRKPLTPLGCWTKDCSCMEMMWTGAGAAGKQDGKWCSILVHRPSMTAAKSPRPIPSVLQSHNNARFSIIGPSITAFSGYAGDPEHHAVPPCSSLRV